MLATSGAAGSRPVVSFDVFDTVITRAVGAPEAMFMLLGRRLGRRHQGIAPEPHAFALLRREAERRLRAGTGGDVPLAAIHRELARSLPPELTSDDLVTEELELERLLSRPVPSGVAAVAAARQSAEVIFVTDTTLPSGFIAELLERAGAWQEGDRVFASCELDATKAEGHLFEVVTERVRPRATIRHHGDNRRSDVRNAGMFGWDGVHRPEAGLNRYEKRLEEFRGQTGGLSSAMSGASRLARLSQEAPDARTAALVEVAAGVMAPVLTSWVLWIMREARASGCEHVDFVSRDGQVLLRIAERLEPKLGTDLTMRYLYSSRQAWTQAAMDTANVRTRLDWDPGVHSVRSALAVFGLDPELVRHRLPPGLREPSAWSRKLTSGEFEAVQEMLAEPEAEALITQRTDSSRRLLLDYLTQEGWAGDARRALVDVGWRGRIAGALDAAISGSQVRLPDRFIYFGLHADALDAAGPRVAERMSSFLFDSARGHGFTAWPAGLPALIEMFCVGDHGPVKGYERVGERVEPVVDEEFAEVQAWGLPIVRRTVDAFVEALVLDDDLIDPHADTRAMAFDVLSLFWEKPSTAEVDAWGDFPVGVDPVHTSMIPLAEPVSSRAVIAGLRAGRRSLRHTASWPAGVAARSSAPYRALLQSMWAARDMRPKVARRTQQIAALSRSRRRARSGAPR